MKKLKLNYSVFLILFFFLTSCSSTKTVLFDQYSYEKTIEIKIETIKLMNNSSASFSKNKEQIDALFFNIEKLTEYEKNKPNNEITFQMWKILSNKEKNLLGGFFRLWETKGIVSKPFLEESQKQILEAFDLLIQYEIKKDKESKNELLDFINLNR